MPHDTPTTDSQGYTLKNILQFTDNDPDALQTILQSFVSSTTEHTRQLENALQNKNTEEISRLAHKMLPLFRQLEVTETVKALQDLEHPEKNNLSPQQISSLTGQAIREARELVQKLRASFHLV
ncbi:MAG TPA: Hpt domain-containing protein [Candidatus Odoribacter faecigallinarum]|uniref:Hpt domain-containing protein n=1 Tax=Candidatus Odoribacter faecigallinarum TaxID=2838706 RepID=A0A9D2AC92_9BACT|nr:Hpt domain-containing protein [Candidatus Odoribacter faecigallinarum]